MYVSMFLVFIISTLVAGSKNFDSFLTNRENFTINGNGVLSRKENDEVNPHRRIGRRISKIWNSDDCKCGEMGDDSLHSGVAKPNAFPWVALIYRNNTKRNRYKATSISFAVGTAINDKYILTAAKQLSDWKRDQLIVILGVHDLEDIFESKKRRLQYQEVKKIILKSKSPTDEGSDIALLKLCERITFNKFIKPICLPNQNGKIDGKIYTLIGWNILPGDYSKFIEKASVKVWRDDYCFPNYSVLTRASICAIYIKYDLVNRPHQYLWNRGGPLFHKDQDGKAVQIGIGSVHMYHNNTGEIYDLYMNVFLFKEWIHENTRDGNYCTG